MKILFQGDSITDAGRDKRNYHDLGAGYPKYAAENIIAAHPDVDFETEEHLIDEKILDSFDIVTLVAEIDSAFDVAIPAEELIPENFNSAKALWALVEKLMEE